MFGLLFSGVLALLSHSPAVSQQVLSTEPLGLSGDQAPEHCDVEGAPTAPIWCLGTWKGLQLGWAPLEGFRERYTLVTVTHPIPRNSCAKDLTSFAAEAIAMNRQLAQCEEDAGQDQPVVIRATSRCLQLSPPSQSKLAQRRQRASLSATPVVLVGDRA